MAQDFLQSLRSDSTVTARRLLISGTPENNFLGSLEHLVSPWHHREPAEQPYESGHEDRASSPEADRRPHRTAPIRDATVTREPPGDAPSASPTVAKRRLTTPIAPNAAEAKRARYLRRWVSPHVTRFAPPVKCQLMLDASCSADA